MTTTVYSSRITRLAEEICEAGLSALLVSNQYAMGYLQGFSENSHERFMVLAIHCDGRVRLICPALSANQAERIGIEDIRGWRDGEDPVAHFRDLVNDWDLKKGVLGIDDEMPAKTLLEIQAVMPTALFRPAGSVIAKLMRVKDQREIDLLRKAGDIADQAFEAGKRAVMPGATELEIADALSTAMKELGGTPTFAIVAVGAASAEPHHLSDHTEVRRGDIVLMDFGCLYEGYHSDITRVVSCGPATEEAHRVYQVVLEAHHAARQAIKVGRACEQIDQAARDVIEQAGYGEFFVHRTGHGIGTRGHEEPYIVAGNKLPVEPGFCFSIEPGIYLPGKFGIRIENIVAATASGHDSMNDEPSATLLEID